MLTGTYIRFRPESSTPIQVNFPEETKMKACKIVFLAMALCLTCGVATTARAQGPGHHPAYLRALSDLRYMRALMFHSSANWRTDNDEQQAVMEIDAAMREIKQAAIDDGKNPDDHPPVDASLRSDQRYRRAKEAGNAALRDLDQEDDNAFAGGLKRRAMDHIMKANR